MMESISFWINGLPQPKGSWTPLKNGRMIPAGSSHARIELANWVHNLRATANAKMQGEPPMEGGIRMMAEFCMPVPMSMPRKAFGWKPHASKPDLDKLVRALGDALSGVAYNDDAQICNLTVAKVYAWNGRTGCNVLVEAITEIAAQRIAHATSALRDYVSK